MAATADLSPARCQGPQIPVVPSGGFSALDRDKNAQSFVTVGRFLEFVVLG